MELPFLYWRTILLSEFGKQVLRMRKYILVMLFTAAVILGACGNPENKFLSNIETIEEDAVPALTDSIQNIIDYEAEMTSLFNTSVTDEELSDFKDDQSPLYENLKQRSELAADLTETEEELKNLSENIAAADVSENEELTEEQIRELAETAANLSESVKNVREGYENVSRAETSFFEALKSEEADYNTLRDGITEVNEVHGEVAKYYQTINEQLQALQTSSNEVKNALGEETSGSEKRAQIDSGAGEVTAEETAEESRPQKLYTVDPETSAIVPSSDEAEPSAVLLTIDDAPDENAVAMAHTLKELDAPAIFFVNGMFIESEEGQEKLREIHELGFEIGNHTYNHFNMQEITPEDTALEIIDTSDLIEEAVGERPKYFRAPFGVNSEASISTAEEENMTVMNWTYGFDWEPEYQEAGALSEIMVNTEMLGDGANLLMHDRTWTSEALPDIVDGLRNQGYTLIDPKTIDAEGGVAE